MNKEEIIAQMRSFRNWEDKYRFVIQLGTQLPSMSEKLKAKALRVTGCESQVWLYWQCESEKYRFYADCDARIVKGLIVLVLAVVEGKTKQQILSFDFDDYLEQLALKQHLSTTRNEGISAIIKAIKAI